MAYVTDGELPMGATHPDLGSNKTADGIIGYGQVGESVVFGNILYPAEDGKWYIAMAMEGMMPVGAMAVWTETANKTIPILHQGYVRNDSWNFPYVPYRKLYVSTTGAIVSSAPKDYRQIIGNVVKPNIIYFNPEHNFHYGYNERLTLKEIDDDIKTLYERNICTMYQCNTWEWDTGLKPIITGKHGRLNITDASVLVADNNPQEQSVEIVDITSKKDISTTYNSGTNISLDIIRSYIGLNEQIYVNISGSRRLNIVLLCENVESLHI